MDHSDAPEDELLVSARRILLSSDNTFTLQHWRTTMAKHFTKANIVNGYAAMGNSLRRPRYAGVKNRDLKAAIAAEKRKAAIAAKIKKSK